MSERLLEVQDLSVRFGGIRAVSGVSLAVGAGEILSIIGPNGAGKTTIFNVVTGLYRPTAGEVRLRGRPISALPPHARARLGVARTFQNIRLFRDLTVGENVRVARYGRARAGLLGLSSGRPGSAGSATRRTPGSRRSSTAWGSATGAVSSPGTFPTATRSGSSWRAPSRSSRACSCSTSRRPA